MNSTQTMRFRLDITPEQYLEYYKGHACSVIARAEDGRRISFPADALRRFLTHDGIYGRFQICFNEHNKLTELERISD